MLIAKAAAVPRLSRSPRVSSELGRTSSSATSATGYPLFDSILDSLTEGPSCKALDEAVEERVVEQRERDGGNQRRRHERLPEEDIPADQVVRDPRGHRSLLGGRDERERVDELVHAEREGEDDRGQDPGKRDRQDDQEERLQSRRPVDQRRVLELLRNGLEEAHEEPCRERHREGRVDEDQRPERVLEVELRDEPREREEEQRRRDQVDEEDGDACALTPPARQPRERVARRQRQEERDADHHCADEQRVEQPGRIVRLLEEERDVLGRRVVPEVPVEAALEVVVEVWGVLHVREVEVRLEHRHEREVERESEHDRERHDHRVGHALLAPRHQLTCALRAKNSIATLPTTSSGNMNSEIAAPSPREPPSMPMKKAQVGNTCVELNGPPRVRM